MLEAFVKSAEWGGTMAPPNNCDKSDLPSNVTKVAYAKVRGLVRLQDADIELGRSFCTGDAPERRR